MDRKSRTRLSLSRKRKIGLTNGEDTNHESFSLKEGSENLTISSDKIAVESKENDVETQDSQKAKKGKFSADKLPKSEALDTHHNNAKKSIATWFKKPCNPKTVSCPMCGKLVRLSKINLHLDNNCEGYFEEQSNSSCKATCKSNELLDSKCHKDEKEIGSVTPNNKITKSKHCASNAECTQSKRKETMDPLLQVVSSTSETSITLDPDVVPLGKMPSGLNRNDKSHGVSNEHSDIVCDGDIKQVSSSQGSDVTETEVTSMHGDDILKTKQVNSSIHKFKTSAKEEPKRSLAEEKILTLNDGIILQTSQTNAQTDQSEHSTCSTEGKDIKKQAQEISESTNDQENKDHEPYYLANFKLVLNNVLSNEDDRQLFNEPDNKIINTFNEMSSEEQKLYIRLFQRKRGWFRCSKLEYPRISSNLTPILKSLVQQGFLEDQSQLTDLRQTLNLIASSELKLLVKSLNVSSKSATKEDTIEAIVSHAENQRTLFGSLKGVVLKKAKQALGCCVRLAADPREVFCRLLLLFTMNAIPDEDDTANNGQAQQLSTLYLANIGKVVYPSYVIDRPTPVFHSRDSLIAFSEAYQQKHEMLMALESNHFEQAYSYYPEASKKFDDILARLKDGSKIPAGLLPEHLRCFTAEWVITKMCYLGVEVLQKWRKYGEAVKQLESLLQQDAFCFDSRGRWYDRRALNLHQHLKQPEKAMVVIRQALSDPHVRFGRHLALIQRAKRILSSPVFKKGKKKKCEDFEDLELKEPNPSKSITISGTRCAELGVFIAPEIDQGGQVIDGTTTFCAVEEYALSYYRQQGFDQGIHGEGSTFSSLYCLFMWDIIFASGIPDVFRSPFQAAPLDMCFDSFYTSRKEMIDKRLKEITTTPVEKLQEMLSKTWNDNEGQVCTGLSWDRFTNVEQAKQLVACLGGHILSGIFTRFAQGYRYHRSGLPDLVVWNSSTLDYMIAEVKGPGDKLSTKQQIWLDVLSSLGANVEVCYVTAVGAKRLKVSK